MMIDKDLFLETTRLIDKQFLPEEWDKLDAEGRLKALNNLEQYMAIIQRRKFVPVVEGKAEDFDEHGALRGTFDGEKIRISPVLLNSGPDSNDESKSEFEFLGIILAETVIHEGRHAYQREIDKGNIEADETQRYMIALNDAYYIDSSNDNGFESLYAMQYIERDAREYAAHECVEMLTRLSEYDPMMGEYLEEYILDQSLYEYANAKEFVKLLEEKPELIDGCKAKMLICYLAKLDSNPEGLIEFNEWFTKNGDKLDAYTYDMPQNLAIDKLDEYLENFWGGKLPDIVEETFFGLRELVDTIVDTAILAQNEPDAVIDGIDDDVLDADIDFVDIVDINEILKGIQSSGLDGSLI